MQHSPRPVHLVHELINGVFPIAVCPSLPEMGNHIDGGKVEQYSNLTLPLFTVSLMK